MVFQRSMLNWRREGGVNLPWVYMHCAIYETYLDECQDDPKIQCSGGPQIYCPLEGGKLEVTLAANLKVTLAVAVNLKVSCYWALDVTP